MSGRVSSACCTARGCVGRLRTDDHAAVGQRPANVFARRRVVVSDEHPEGLGLLRCDVRDEAHSSSSTLVPGSAAGVDAQFPSERFGAVLHRHEPEAALWFVFVEAGSVVHDPEAHARVGALEIDPQHLRAAVLGGVGDSLGGDADHRLFLPRGQRDPACELHVHRGAVALGGFLRCSGERLVK